MKIAAVIAVAIVAAALILVLSRLARRALDARQSDPYRGLSRRQRRELIAQKHRVELLERENRAYDQLFTNDTPKDIDK